MRSMIATNGVFGASRVRVGHTGELCRNGWTHRDAVWELWESDSRTGPRNGYWRHLANTIERAACCGDAAFAKLLWPLLMKFKSELTINVGYRPIDVLIMRWLRYFEEWSSSINPSFRRRRLCPWPAGCLLNCRNFSPLPVDRRKCCQLSSIDDRRLSHWALHLYVSFIRQNW